MADAKDLPGRGLRRVTREDMERVLALAGIPFDPPVEPPTFQPETPELVSA